MVGGPPGPLFSFRRRRSHYRRTKRAGALSALRRARLWSDCHPVRYFREYGQELLPPQQPHRSGFQRADGGMPALRQAAASIPQEKTEKILLGGLPPRMVEAAPGAYP